MKPTYSRAASDSPPQSEYEYRERRGGPSVAARLGKEDRNSSVAVRVSVANLNLVDFPARPVAQERGRVSCNKSVRLLAVRVTLRR